MKTIQFKAEDMERLEQFRKLLENSHNKRYSLRMAIMKTVEANFPGGKWWLRY